jgi:hypothetical protein
MPHSQSDPAAVRSQIEDSPGFYQAIWGRDIVHLHEMIRQQILGDRELLRDVDRGYETELDRQTVVDRLFFIERLARVAGLDLPPLLVDEGRDVLSELTDDSH